MAQEIVRETKSIGATCNHELPHSRISDKATPHASIHPRPMTKRAKHDWLGRPEAADQKNKPFSNVNTFLSPKLTPNKYCTFAGIIYNSLASGVNFEFT